MKHRRHQAGDTIVEVMMAIVVLGLSLSAGYAIASRSLRAARQAQEHGEALKLGESQLEQMKAKASNGDTDIFTSATPFCIIGNAPVTAGCNFNTLYNVEITRGPDLGHNNYEFDLVVKWDSIGASLQDQVTLHYRLLKEN